MNENYLAGQQANDYELIFNVLGVTNGKVAWPTDNLVDLNGFVDFLDADNTIKFDLDNGTKSYTGNVTLTNDNQSRVNALCDIIKRCYLADNRADAKLVTVATLRWEKV